MMRPIGLIVEDNRNMAAAFAEALHQAGFATEIAGDGAAALFRLIKEPRPDLILLDLNLPKVKGGEILTSIRKNKHLAELRVIIISANDREAEMHRESADLVLLKPIGFNQLREIASRMLPSNLDRLTKTF